MSQKNLPTGKSYTRKKIQNYSYGLGDTIGKGYSSQVYRGRHDNTQQPVAVKVIDLKMLKCEINRTLLASQIQILKSLKNTPHILTLHEVYTTKNNTYIITQLCETDLSTKIKKGLPQTECYNYMNQILQGYSHIFQKGLIHRDLKPANLLITPENQVKIADFGFGVKMEEVLKPSKYNVGSPLYMAPQSLKRNQYSFRTDIWALGIIFFQMLTGDTPWRAKNQKQLLKKIQSEKITQILTRHKFSTIVNQFLTKCLCQDKNSRIGPQQLIKYNFKNKEKDYGSVLGERQLNSIGGRNQRFQSIVNQPSSPKTVGRSIEKRLFYHDKSDKKIQPKTMNTTQTLQNMSTKNIENHQPQLRPQQSAPLDLGSTHPSSSLPLTSPTLSPVPTQTQTQNSIQPTLTHAPTASLPLTTVDTMSKQDKKYISKLLIAQVHFCRFLYKLLGRVKESANGNGLFCHEMQPFTRNLYRVFTTVIERKVCMLKDFQNQDYLGIGAQRFEEYHKTNDFKKLKKIAKDYYDRYSTQLSQHWTEQPQKSPKQVQHTYKQCINQVTQTIQKLLLHLPQYLQSLSASSNPNPNSNPNSNCSSNSNQFLSLYTKDIIILDYLITCKQLFEMIEKQVRNNCGRENYDKFAKKSRIEEIVQGATSQINMELYNKIMDRGRLVINRV